MLNLLWVLAVIFIVLWVVGLASAYTMGGLIHVLLVVAIITVVVRVLAGRRVV